MACLSLFLCVGGGGVFLLVCGSDGSFFVCCGSDLFLDAGVLLVGGLGPSPCLVVVALARVKLAGRSLAIGRRKDQFKKTSSNARVVKKYKKKNV